MTDRHARRLVTAGTLLLAGWAAGFVLRYGANLPHTDEWDYPFAVAGPPPWGWLLDHHNEHRYPLGRLVWAGAVRAAGDFRGPMLLTVGLLAVASVLLTAAARRVRGRAVVGDLAVPALLLHGGHAFNLLMGYQVGVGLYAVGLAGAAWAAVAGRLHTGGAFALLVAQCGGFGLAAAGPLVLWLMWEGRTRPAVLVWPAVIVCYCGWAAVTLPPSVRPPGADPVTGTAVALALGAGLWVPPLGRVGWFAVAAGVATAYLGATVLARRSAGLLAVVAVGPLAAAAVGYGRGEWALADRFVTPAAVGLAVAWVPLGRRLGWVGLPLAVAVLAANHRPGERFGQTQRGQVRAFQTDLRAGLPPVFLAGKHGGGLPFLSTDAMHRTILALREAGWPGFREVAADPPFTAVPVSLTPFTLVCGPEPFLPGGPPPPGVDLGTAPPGAIGVRVRGEQRFPMGYQLLRVGPEAATPRVVPGRYEVAVPVTPGAAVRVEAGCPMPGLTVEAADWLVTP